MDIQKMNSKELNDLYDLLHGMKSSINSVLEKRTDLSSCAAHELRMSISLLDIECSMVQDELALRN